MRECLAGKQAEDMLSKSLKLQPTKREAWDALGHVYWKKNDLAASKKCFESSLEQDENNKEVLLNLSMVCRQQQEKDDKTRKAIYKLSISLDTKACGIDMKDSQSWCKLLP
jgi:cytochrome c-type biogenesis protein CcmH/NrfG